MIIFVLVFIERYWALKQVVSKTIIYENIENIKPENYNLLKNDLELRTGISINSIDVGDVDFLRDIATVTIFYYKKSRFSHQLIT